MEITEKFAVLNSVITATGMTEEEIINWFNSRHTSPASTTENTISPTGNIKPIFPIAYKKGNEFEILPELIGERINEIWGYEIIPNVILSKKCGADGNMENTTWYSVKTFAEKCMLNGKKGQLPSKEVLGLNWSVELRDKIQAMDNFLHVNAIDAEIRSVEKEVYIGVPWCLETNGDTKAYSFNLNTGCALWYYKNCFCNSDRIVVSF